MGGHFGRGGHYGSRQTCDEEAWALAGDARGMMTSDDLIKQIVPNIYSTRKPNTPQFNAFVQKSIVAKKTRKFLRASDVRYANIPALPPVMVPS